MQSITTFYKGDHDQLDEAFLKFQELKRKDYPLAKEYFKKFKFGLQRHIIWEEEILFSLFEEKTGMKNCGPTFVMRQEHQQIKSLMENLHKKVQRQNPESDQEEQLLWDVLKQHNYKEEQILYPALDGHLNAVERQQLFSSMNDLPKERYATCCHMHF